MTAGSAWYQADRATFLREDLEAVVGRLAKGAIEQGLHIEIQQRQEWESSVDLLQSQLGSGTREVKILRDALSAPDLAEFTDIILEYDFRRRGLRLDCVLLGAGIIAVVEFKRSTIGAADRDQVTNYCINLVEFHEETRRACKTEGCIIAPVLALTATGASDEHDGPSVFFHNPPWDAVLRVPLECDRATLHLALRAALKSRREQVPVRRAKWMSARFSPSSTILDAAISLYGQHDVAAISTHAAPIELIDRCTREIAAKIELSKQDRQNRILFVSGAPGAGKTLVGLKLAFDQRFRNDAVFVTGNAPLVDVLTEALRSSYRATRSSLSVLSGYSKEQVFQVVRMSTFKLVKAHTFLGERGRATGSADGRIVIFDEAQRTYEKGRAVLRRELEEDEAHLILQSLERSYDRGAVVVALVGHKQAINRGELGIAAWFKAAKALGWRYAISDETLSLSGSDSGSWAHDRDREILELGHLPHSLRFYRNGDVERWADSVLEGDSTSAARIAHRLRDSGDTIWLTRDLAKAKAWVRDRRIGEERAGIIASGQARRLSAEGLFVDLKPDIATWMLAPSGDIRSSNMLETVQNQYQIQGLEIDYAIVCWDADLRRDGEGWASYRINGAKWQRDRSLDIAKNGYRVLLTRARKGMIIFVPRGDDSRQDGTRPPQLYDRIASHLTACGAHQHPVVA